MDEQRLKPVVATCQALGQRRNQEDAIAISPETFAEQKGMLAVLCDGMGGMNAGEKFSAIGTKEMVACFEKTPAQEDICAELLSCMEAAQQATMRAQEDSSSQMGGSTLTAVLIRDRRCAFISAGDSRIYLWRGGGLLQLTRDQVLGDLLDERAALGLIPTEDAKRNIRRASLVNGLGVNGAIPCDRCVEPFTLLAGDRLALMSDGVFGTLEEEEFSSLLALPPDQAAARIIEEVQARKKPRQDNCSIVVISMEEAAL